jgi:branched-chain amino acid transport system ATP-binding protein
MILELDGLSKSFGRLKVADAISFGLAEGEALGVVGPNGAGKTTLFSLIGGALKPDAGAVRLMGRDITNDSPQSRCAAGVARTHQIPRPLPLLDRKRLELARALATELRVLLLDEIAGGLTEGECRELVKMIRAISASGVAILWIEHIVHALLAVVTRLVVLNFGQLIAQGEPRAVMASRQVREIYLGAFE